MDGSGKRRRIREIQCIKIIQLHALGGSYNRDICQLIHSARSKNLQAQQLSRGSFRCQLDEK